MNVKAEIGSTSVTHYVTSKMAIGYLSMIVKDKKK